MPTAAHRFLRPATVPKGHLDHRRSISVAHEMDDADAADAVTPFDRSLVGRSAGRQRPLWKLAVAAAARRRVPPREEEVVAIVFSIFPALT